jgi:hypothetical protein
MIYSGKCHCGKLAFEVEGDLTEVIECNLLASIIAGATAEFLGGRPVCEQLLNRMPRIGK